MKNKKLGLAALLVAVVMALSMILIIGTDTNWGKTEVTHLTLTTADGDEISAMLYKPNTATPETPAPCAMLCHGGNDMLEQTGTYALELARRGYVVVTWDYSGCHDSDIPTGTSEGNRPESGLPTMGADTVWNTVKAFNFVDFTKIVTMGHSMGGQYTMAFAIEHQQEVFLQVNLGMNAYGAATNQDHNFNFTLILGDADESCLARSDNNVASVFQGEQVRRVFAADYTSDAAAVPEIEIGKLYTVDGTDGKTYNRSAYMPDSCHAYYLVTDDAIQTVLYSITSQVGVGLDDGVSTYADHNKISLVWKGKDIGFGLLLAAVVGLMFVVGCALFETHTFASLKLQKQNVSLSFKKKTWQWYVFFAIMFILPVILYRPGILASRSFLGIDVSKLWLLGGTNNAYISWQWMVSIGMLVVFLIYHFLWGRKHGGNMSTYGFATSDNGGFHMGYILKSLCFGLLVVGSGYLAFGLVSAYTHQGMHIATFMLSTIKANRTLCILMYFLFQIPYFLTSSLAAKSLGIMETTDDTKGTLKSIGIGMLVSIGGLFLLWVVFMLILLNGNTLTNAGYFRNDRMYIYTIAILPLAIGMSIANGLNMFVSKKTNSIWSGLFTALLWGTWMIISCGGMAKYLY